MHISTVYDLISGDISVLMGYCQKSILDEHVLQALRWHCIKKQT